MSFREFLMNLESTGSITGLSPGEWPDDSKNGKEFNNKRVGIRSNIETEQEEDEKPRPSRKKSAMELYKGEIPSTPKNVPLTSFEKKARRDIV